MSIQSNTENINMFENHAKSFCHDFCFDQSIPKYILGRNIYAQSIFNQIKVDGFIDDYTKDTTYLNIPIIKMDSIPKNSLVLNVAGGSPLTARDRLLKAGLRNLDYFSFYRFSGLDLIEMRFNEGFKKEFLENNCKYSWIYNLLEDADSKSIFQKLVGFRSDYDINFLEGFTWREDFQYFESFLGLNILGESFVDVGGFDGFTSKQFIAHCPGYKSINVFEPEPANFGKCIENLSAYRNIKIHNVGLSNEKANLKIDVMGSGSNVSESGTVDINVDTLDSILNDVPTFIKMDIEGGELAALKGSYNLIKKHHPKLAISVYHKPGDFWRIPEFILSIRSDYSIYMRHYTECIYETVMFFIPKT